VVDRHAARYLDDHKVGGVVVAPASLFVEMAMAIAQQLFGTVRCELTEVELMRALVVSPKASLRIQAAYLPHGLDGGDLQFFSTDQDASGGWTLHVTMKLRRLEEEEASSVRPADLAKPHGAQEIDRAGCYAEFERRGETYGPWFQGISALWQVEGQVLAELKAPEPVRADWDAYHFHPAMLDACMHALVLVTPARGETGFMPTHFDRIVVHGPASQHLWSSGRLRRGASLRPTSSERRRRERHDADVRITDSSGVPVMSIHGARLQYLDELAKRRPRETSERWCYDIRWVPNEPAAGAPRLERGKRWLLLADRAGVARALAERMSRDGDECELIESTADLRTAIRTADESTTAPLAGIVHLFALDAADATLATADALSEAQRLGIETLLHVVRAVSELRTSGALPRLWVVTRGAQHLPGDAQMPGLLQAPCTGLARTLAQEQPSMWGGLVDLDPLDTCDDSAACLARLLTGQSREDQFAVRAKATFVARLARKTFEGADVTPLRWRLDGTYLITGGLGGLGLVVATWMAEQGARRLVLTTRRGLPPRERWSELLRNGGPEARQIEAVRRIEALGADVRVLAVDVGDEARMREFVASHRREGWPPIRGVVHAAGVVEPAPLTESLPKDVDAVLRAKVTGGWVLDRSFPELDFFVLFSSASAIMSSPGMGIYASGNAFLDALAHARRARGQHALSIDWGPWAEVGMAAAYGGDRGPLQLEGTQSISSAVGIHLMERFMVKDATQVAVLPFDWSRWRAVYPSFSRAPIYDDLYRQLPPPASPADSPAAAVGEATEPPALTLGQLRALADPAERLDRLEAFLKQGVAHVLGTRSVGIDASTPLLALGLDSLMVIEMRAQILSTFGVSLRLIDLLGGASVKDIATSVASSLFGSGGA
jgi:acyl transferase domain-containing protein/acyl carrier protein